MSEYRIEQHDLHGDGPKNYKVYPVPRVVREGIKKPKLRHDWNYWPAVTNVPCPVEGCDQIVASYEAGYVPGYRACMRQLRDTEGLPVYDRDSVRHKFLAGGSAPEPTLILDE